MATESQRSETTATAASSSEPAGWPTEKSDVGADAALILAALGRLATAIQDERALLAKLRDALGDMARAIATAKAVADSETAAALLDEFEHRVDAMIEIAGGRAHEPAQAEQAAAIPTPVPEVHVGPPPEALQEPEQVPTVSSVIAPQLQGEPVIDEPTAAPETAGGSAPTLAMLTAMVEALRDAIPADPEPPASEPEPEPAPEPTNTMATEFAPAVAGQAPEPDQPVPDEHAAAEWSIAESVTSELQAAEIVLPSAPVETASAEPTVAEIAPGEPPFADAAAVEPVLAAPVVAEETFPEATAATLPPVEVFGAAAPAPPAAEAGPEPPTEAAAPVIAETAASPEPAPEPAPVVPSEQALMQESRLLSIMERIAARPFAPPDAGTAVIFTQPAATALASTPEQQADEPAAVEAAQPEAADSLIVPPSAEMPVRTALPEPSPVSDQPGPSPIPDQAPTGAAETAPEFDPSDFLFGPKPEPEPAAFLLEPSPAEAANAAIPQEPARASSRPETAQPDAVAAHDPLQALNAMTPEERLAVFS